MGAIPGSMPLGEVVESSHARAMSSETPDDVATLYSWANLRGAKYRDFSAARARVREEARKRVQEAMDTERKRAEVAVVSVVVAEPVVMNATEKPPTAAKSVEANVSAKPSVSPFIETVVLSEAAPLPAGQGRGLGSFTPPLVMQPVPATSPLPVAQEPVSRPWINEPQASQPQARQPQIKQTQTGLPQVQPIAPRWFALNGIFPAVSNTEPTRARARVPALAVFSLAGGVGKTSLVATLGRALAARSERVLLVDTAPFGILPFFFGATDQRPGMLRTFTAPGAGHGSGVGSGVRMEVLALDVDRLGPEGNVPEPFTQEILRHAGGANRILMDIGTASGATVRRILRMTPTVLAPLAPDMSSVASLTAIEAFFERNAAATGQRVAPYYLLNQFDESQRLHRAVLELLRERLGERLLPFVVRRTEAVSEALAEGMTVIDYAPDSQGAADYAQLAEWVRSLAAPAVQDYSGARWSER